MERSPAKSLFAPRLQGLLARPARPAGPRRHRRRPGPDFRRPASNRTVWLAAGLLLLTLSLLVLRYGW